MHLLPVEVLMPGGVLHIQDSPLRVPEIVEVFVKRLFYLEHTPGHLGASLAKEAG